MLEILPFLKIPPYPTHSDNYSLAIKFNIMSLSKLYLLSFDFVCMGKGNLQMTDSDRITPCIAFLLHCASDVNVSFEDVLNHVTKCFLTCFTLNRLDGHQTYSFYKRI